MTNTEVEWQQGCIKLSQRGAHILQSGIWSDCSFLVRGQVTVKGHKLILAMASPVFAAMFHGGHSDSSDPISIVDIKPEVFKALLEYIYIDKIADSFDLVFDLYYAAKKYMLPHLVKECSMYISSHMSPENSCRVYELARLFDDKFLMDHSLKVIRSNTKKVLNNSSFLEIDVKTMETVFSLEYMKIKNEVELLDALVRYLKALNHRTEKNITAENIPNVEDDVYKVSAPQSTSNISTRNTTEAKSRVRNALKQIRFLTLTPQQFAGIHSKLTQPGMLTDPECYALLMNIASSTSSIPMPDGFSTNRQPRNSKAESKDDLAEDKYKNVYCSRPCLPSGSYYGAKYCYVSFAADHDVVLLGVQVPSQTKVGELLVYCEDITVRLWSAEDSDCENFIVNVDLTRVVKYDQLLDIKFPKACSLIKDQVYVILIQFFAKGKYPKGVCMPRFDARASLLPVTFRVVDADDNENEDLLRTFVIQAEML